MTIVTTNKVAEIKALEEKYEFVIFLYTLRDCDLLTGIEARFKEWADKYSSDKKVYVRYERDGPRGYHTVPTIEYYRDKQFLYTVGGQLILELPVEDGFLVPPPKEGSGCLRSLGNIPPSLETLLDPTSQGFCRVWQGKILIEHGSYRERRDRRDRRQFQPKNSKSKGYKPFSAYEISCSESVCDTSSVTS